MNTLKAHEAKIYKRAFESGLSLIGVEDNKPQWIGDSVQWENYHYATQETN